VTTARSAQDRCVSTRGAPDRKAARTRRASRVGVLLALATATLASSRAVAQPAGGSPSSPAAASAPSADPTIPTSVARPCSDPAVTGRLAALVHARRFADAHHAATDLRVQCGNQESWRLLDDVALIRLEDRVYALADLTNRDTEAASAILPRIPEPRRAALIALAALPDEDRFAAAARSLDPRALALGRRYHAARVKSPALAGVMSAVLPGSGQLYAGSLQAAAVTLVLNSLFIGATVELARDKDYVTAAAAGTAASVFYLGGIINAADLARRRNRIAQQPYADALEELLLPEVGGTLGP
jgi:hypothetical protein